MPKYKKYFEKMLEVEGELFKNFKGVHDNYTLNPGKYQEEFNQVGERVVQIIAHWENKLCLQSEKGGYGNFAANLAEKFHAEVRKAFPEIDSVGLISKDHQTLSPLNPAENFFIKQIRL